MKLSRQLSCTNRHILASFLLGLILAGTCLYPTPALAHKLRVFAWVSNDTVTVESSFSGGRTLIEGAVEVQDATTGATLLRGKTDNKGVFTFSLREAIKQPGASLRIVVAGGEGHQNEWLLKPEDYLTTTDSSGSVKAETKEQPSQNSQLAQTPESAKTGAATKIGASALTIGDREELAKILDERLEAKLAPLRRSLAQTEEHRPQFTDILGGIGYLIGIAGIIAWTKSRKS